MRHCNICLKPDLNGFTQTPPAIEGARGTDTREHDGTQRTRRHKREHEAMAEKKAAKKKAAENKAAENSADGSPRQSGPGLLRSNIFNNFNINSLMIVVAWAAALGSLALTPSALGQQVEAVVGEPFHVGHVALTVGRGEDPPRLVEKDGRALYVAAATRQRGLLLDRGESTDYWFLFRGDKPLTLTWPNTQATTVVEPQAIRERLARRMLGQWWDAFVDQTEQRMKDGHHPPVADHYLLAMLASRLQLPLKSEQKRRDKEDRPLETIELLAGAERLRSQVLREAMRSDGESRGERSAPPAAVLWDTSPMVPTAEDVTIEPIAKLVPPECLYVRFGRFSNFLWLTHLIREQGGDLGSMISARGYTRDLDSRFERQFAIRYSVLADLLGDHVVEDLALIGADLYVADGAAMGVLLQAKNSVLLDAALGRERAATVSREAEQGVSKQTIQINGHPTELVVTPDNRVRSYLAAHKQFRLIANSRHVVERFWAVVDGATSLGELNEFRHARSRMAVEQDYTLFAYFSTHFFHNLVSPQYQIELKRRLRAIADFQIFELAVIAARREGLPDDEASLVKHGLLPADWGRRPDGSRLLRTKSGQLVDSMRGARGTLLPIPDVVLRDVTAAERQEFVEMAGYYQTKWRTMDPLMAAIKRFQVEGHARRERLVVDAQVSPFVERKYSRWLSLLGEPTMERITGPKEAIIRGQASVRGGLLRPSVPPHQLFLGIIDQVPNIDDLQMTGILDTLRTVQAMPGYLGAWPRPGFLDRFPLSPRNREDDQGYSRLPLRLWRWREGDYSVLSFDKQLLAGVQPTLDVEQSEAPTQAWLRVGDLSESNLAPWIRHLNHQQAIRMSQGNARWLTTLTETMGASVDEAQTLAGRLVDGDVQCPLGGELKPQMLPGLVSVWESSEFPEEPPQDYVAPLLRWFRGGAVMLNSGGNRLIVHGELDIERVKSTVTAPDPASLALPLLRGLPSLFGGGAKDGAKDDGAKDDGANDDGAKDDGAKDEVKDEASYDVKDEGGKATTHRGE